MGNRREAMQVAGAALVGTVCASSPASAEPPAPGPVVVMAGKNTEEKGFKVKEVDFKRGSGYAVTFDKPLAKSPVVVVTSCGAGVPAGVQDVSEKGFTVTFRLQGLNVASDFFFIVVLV